MSDDETDIPATPPVLEDYEADAVFAILVRVIRTDLTNQSDKDKIAELQAAIDERLASRPKLMTALHAFGFMSGPGIWDQVTEVLGKDRYNHAWEVALPEKYGPARKIRATGSEPASTNPRSLIKGEVNARGGSEQAPPKISEAILTYLRSVGGRGVQVAEIKRHLLDAYGLVTHQKTPGMTLYRLSQQGVVRRDGRDWFAEDIPESIDLLAFADEAKETATDQ
jgi:hypothetical protein